MRPETRAAIYDMKSGLEEIQALVPRPEDFGNDRTIALAVERLLLIVGEAMVRVKALDEPIFAQFPEGARLIAMRNLIVHA